MTLRFVDGFDHLAIADVGQKWTSIASASIQTGRFGTGQSLRLINTSGSVSKTIDNQASWVVGFAFRAALIPTTQSSLLLFKDAGTLQCDLRINLDNTLSVTRNGTAVTGGTSSNALLLNVWYYIEMKVTIADSIGANSCKVRVNGADWITVTTGQDLKNTANATANSITFGPASTNNLNWDIDDVYICDSNGSVNNDFLGDVRAEVLYPSATGNSSQWTPSPSSATWGQLQTNGAASMGAVGGIIVFQRIAAAFSGTLSQVQLSLNANLTGKMNVAVYSDVGGSPSALLAQSTEKTNPTAATLTFTLASTIAMTQGTNYWVAVWSNNSLNFMLATTSIVSSQWGLQTLTYASTFPSVGGPITPTPSTASFYIALDVTSIPRVSSVAEPQSDGDTGYIETSTVSNKDTYAMADMASTPSSIKGVQTCIAARKTDAGVRSVAAVVRSGGADFDGATVALGASFAVLTEVRETDPNTSAAWAAAAVNAMEVGVKLIA